VNASLAYSNTALGITAPTLAIGNLLIAITGKNYQRFTMEATTSAVAVPTGGLSNIGWVILINRDPTNYVKVLTGTAGTVFGRMEPGEPIMLRIDPSVTAPAVQANTASCLVEGLMLEI
jgi:hypothetical protein